MPKSIPHRVCLTWLYRSREPPTAASTVSGDAGLSDQHGDGAGGAAEERYLWGARAAGEARAGLALETGGLGQGLLELHGADVHHVVRMGEHGDLLGGCG